MTSTDVRTYRAPAKINLALAVAPPDDQGMHPICSWMACIELFDELRLRRRAAGTESVFTIRWAADAPAPSPIDWPLEKNLAVRALRAMEHHFGHALPVDLTMEKRIPVGAGLAGGSSNAATMLIALRDLFALDCSDADLSCIAATLGSDVAFFAPPRAGDPAIVGGLGERITRTPPVAADLLLILPPFGCATGRVYRAFDDDPASAFREADIRALAEKACIETDALFNDLAEPAMRVRPELRYLRERAEEAAGTPVHITGSGSGMFIVDPAHATESAIAEAAPGCVRLRTRIARAPSHD